MSLWSRLACAVLGRCEPSRQESSEQLIDALHESVASTVQIKHEIKAIKESGIWPQDLIRGTYRVNRRKVRHDQS
jgi:hypothetical protein